MVYYFLLAGLLTLVLVYIVYILWKNKISSAPTNQLLYIPTLISLLIILWYGINESHNQVDVRKNEYIAVGMKHYDKWERILFDGEKITNHQDLFTGVYKDWNGVYKEFEITKPTYYYFKDLWKGKKEIILSDNEVGKVSFIEWDKNPKTSLIYTKSEIFTNYFKSTADLYEKVTVTEQDIKNLKLYSENRIDHINKHNVLEPRQSLIYGIQTSDSIDRYISNLSSLDPEFRPILLVWVDSCNTIDKKKLIRYQKSYWGGGKNNEVVFCVGINNSVDKKIIWSSSFSWAITKDLENYVLGDALKPGNILNSRDYYRSIMTGYSKNYWKPRKFEAYTVMGFSIMDFMMLLMSGLIIFCNLALVIKINIEKKKELS